MMRKKVYYLSTCSTCKRIMAETGMGPEFERQDIKTESITPAQLREMADLAGSYEALFSKTARKYKDMGLKDRKLKEEDYRGLILEEYTFLKRPVFLIGNEIFVGNSPKTVAALGKALAKES